MDKKIKFSLKPEENKATEQDRQVLEAAYRAWMGWEQFRLSRKRNKDYTYGRQWGDIRHDDDGNPISEGDYVRLCGKEPLTNNMLRQLIKCVVGRFRKTLSDEKQQGGDDYQSNFIDEIDSRALEEFLISGCCVQRVEWADEQSGSGVWIENVNVNRFFCNRMEDPRGHDCEIIGCLHNMRLSELIRRLADGNIQAARRIRNAYAAPQSIYQSAAIGQDGATNSRFWHGSDGKCRAIEVWTLELAEVLRCHDTLTAQLTILPASKAKEIEQQNAKRRKQGKEEIIVNWSVAQEWHCRWFAPSGVLLRHFTSPFAHHSHPFVFKLYPLTDGEIHSFIEDVIDQQKYVNRLITSIDHIMSASAKGVLLFPTEALPDGYTWGDVRKMWSNCNGIIPIDTDRSASLPQQVVSRSNDTGAYQLLSTQMKLIEQISGVTSVLQGQQVSGNQSAELYQTQMENSETALADIYGSFDAFRTQRQVKAQNL